MVSLCGEGGGEDVALLPCQRSVCRPGYIITSFPWYATLLPLLPPPLPPHPHNQCKFNGKENQTIKKMQRPVEIDKSSWASPGIAPTACVCVCVCVRVFVRVCIVINNNLHLGAGTFLRAYHEIPFWNTTNISSFSRYIYIYYIYILIDGFKMFWHPLDSSANNFDLWNAIRFGCWLRFCGDSSEFDDSVSMNR